MRCITWSLIVSIALITGCQSVYQPLTTTELEQQLEADLSAIFTDQPDPQQPISLAQAMSRAVVYNLDQQVLALETSIAREAAGLSAYQQLPRLDLFADHTQRSRATTFDQDLEQSTASLSLAWNILDFGVSYIRSRQQANKALAAEERRLRAANKLAIQTHNVYWRALAAKQLEEDIKPLQIKLQQALQNARIAEQRRLQPPLELLDYQKTLLDIMSQLQQLQKELVTARINLNKLINVSPGTPLELIHPASEGLVKPKLPAVGQLEQFALRHRPELREANYQRRVKADETKKAMLRMLPGLEFNIGERYNSGDSYVNNLWAEAGVQITWNLMNLLSAPATLRFKEAEQNLQRIRRLALHISVLSQVQIAYRQFQESNNSYAVARNLSHVTTRLFEHASAGRQSIKLSEMMLIRREADKVLYQIRQRLAHADLQAARGDLYLSVGQSIIPDNAILITYRLVMPSMSCYRAVIEYNALIVPLFVYYCLYWLYFLHRWMAYPCWQLCVRQRDSTVLYKGAMYLCYFI